MLIYLNHWWKYVERSTSQPVPPLPHHDPLCTDGRESTRVCMEERQLAPWKKDLTECSHWRVANLLFIPVKHILQPRFCCNAFREMPKRTERRTVTAFTEAEDPLRRGFVIRWMGFIPLSTTLIFGKKTSIIWSATIQTHGRCYVSIIISVLCSLKGDQHHKGLLCMQSALYMRHDGQLPRDWFHGKTGVWLSCIWSPLFLLVAVDWMIAREQPRSLVQDRIQ